MFEYKGDEYTLKELQDYVTQNNLDFDTYMSNMKSKGLTEIKPVQVADNTEGIDAMLDRQDKVEVENKAPEDKGFIEDMVQVFKQSRATGGSVEEAFDLFKLGNEISDEQLQAVIDARDKMAEYGPTNEQFEFAKSQKEYGGGIVGTLLALNDNKGFIPQFIVGSAVTMATSLGSDEVAGTTALSSGVGAAGGSLAGPAGAITGAMSGAIGGLVGSMETGLTLMDLIQDEVGGAKLTKENIRAIIEDTEKFETIKQRATARGRNIGLIEAMTFGISKGVGSQLARAGKFRRAIAVPTAIEATGGFTGEVAGQIGAGQEIDLGEATLESIGEVVGVEQAVNLSQVVRGTLQKSQYIINDEKRTKQEILDLINSDKLTNEEKSKIKFDIKNDEKFAQLVGQKLNDAALETQIDAKVEDPVDREKLVDLEKQRAKAESDTKKKGIFKVFDSETKLEKIEGQINEIVGKYTATDGRLKEVRARKKVAKEVRESRKQMLMDKITQGVKDNRTYKNMDINIEEVETELEARELFEQDVNKEILVLEEELKNPDLNPEETAEITDELNAAKAAIKNIDSKKSEAGLSHGFLLEDAQTGKMTIVINKQKAIADGAGNINVAAHEFLHAVLRRTFGNKSSVKPASDLVRFLEENKQFFGTEFIQRLGSYNAGEQQNQEVFTLLSDALVKGDININESFGQRLGGFVSDFLTAVIPGKKIKFKNGRDAFRFIKNYNKSIKGNRIASRIVEKAQKQGIQFEDQTAAETTSRPLSKEASDKVQQSYEAKNEGFEFDIIKEFKPITSRIAEKRREAPNFDKELLMSEIEIGSRGILDLIKEYKPESGVPLAAFINKFLPSRAIEASRRVLGEEFMQDVSERVDIAAEEVAETEVQAKPKEKKTVVAKRLGVSDKAVKAIKKILPDLDTSNLTFKSLKNQVPGIIGELFGISPKKIVSKANITKSELLSSQMFINKNADLLMAMLPEGATPGGTATGVPKTLLDAFYTKTDRAKAATTGSKAGLAVQQKNKIDKTQFLETFGIIEGKPVRTDRNTSARVLALADMVGKMITNQTVREELATQPGKKQDITRIAEGKSQTMFSKEAEKIQEQANRKKNFRGPLAPTSEILTETEKKGKVKVKVITRRDLNQYQNEKNKITWEEFYMSQILDFLEKFPQYYEVMSTGLTGGIKKAAFFNIPYFRSTLEKYAKKSGRQNIIKKIDSTKQVKPSRTYYHKAGSIFKGIKNINFSNENGKIEFLEQFFRDIAKHGKGEEIFQELLTHLGFDQSNFMRHAGVLLVYPVNAKGKEVTNQIGVEEHDPQMEMARVLFAAARDGNIEDAIKLLRFGYSQSSLRKKDDPGGDLRQSRGKDFFEKVLPRVLNNELDFLPDGFGAIYRFMKAGVDPNAYALIKGNQTIAEYFGVDNLSVEKAREAIIGVFEGTQNIEVLRSQRKIDLQNKEANIKLSKAVVKSRTMHSKPSKGITILDFDDTLATTKSLVRYTTPDGKTGTLNAEEYASTYEDLLDLGYVFDFSDFNKVVKGKLAPLFQKALKLQGKFGPENMFVLTARPPQAQKAIFDFLKANGLNIPLKNITGLGNSTAEAKALWIADKVGEGFNDFYFADDALQNVQAVDNMLEQFDVKRKVQQARVKFSKPANLDKTFNDIIQDVTGIESEKRFAATKARKRGASKGKFRLFIPPSHEDFVGLLYNFMGKGRKGDAHRAFLEKALVRPINRAHREIDAAKQAVANDYKALNKQMSGVRNILIKNTPDGDFTYQDAIRVYLWDKHGYKIPGLSEVDQASLVDIVKQDPDLQAYAEALNTISKQETYVDPGPNWETGNIRIDLVDATGRVGRATYFAEFQENADAIFSEENLNKIEAGYGKPFREALEDMLYRIKTGINRPKGSSAKPNIFMNWLNASVSGVMFFNTRSSILQQMSNVNYLNFADNNILAAGKAFANQKQYWKDFAMIFNSDMLKQRRGGLQTDINGAELAEAIKKARPNNLFDQVAVIVGKALKLGFLPTQIGDNIAIATGGAAFYRNRVNKYIKDGFPIDQAEKKAFNDFQEITQSTQQSAKPYMTSQQQAMWIGKLVLNFLNTPSQYNRIIKKAASDIINRRITPPNTTQMQSDMSNMSRILYYGAAQNILFYSLQTALFAVMFGGEDEDEEKRIEQYLKKKERVINGSIDTILRGSGIYGVAVSTLKNMAIKFMEQREAGYNKDESAVIMEMLNFSPVVGIKARRIVNAEKTLNYNKKVIEEMETFDIDNPMWSAVTNYTQTITTAPTNKIYQKTINLRNAADNDYTALQRLMFLSGYTTWSLNLGDTKKMQAIKDKIKADKKKAKSKSKANKKSYKIIYE